jgi:hypothetical protein
VGIAVFAKKNDSHKDIIWGGVLSVLFPLGGGIFTILASLSAGAVNSIVAMSA